MDSSSDMTLFNDSNAFVVKKDNNYISIQKSLTPTITKNIEYKENKQGIRILGIVGVLEGKQFNYLLVISKASYIGFIQKSRVFKVSEIECINFSSSGESKSDEENYYTKMIKDFIQRNALYFSVNYDLTSPIFKMFKRENTNTPRSPFSTLNPIFCWNHSLGRIYDTPDLNTILIPLINGSVGIAIVPYNTNNKPKEFCFVLISRKDSRRSGMRFLVRGADSNGHVANFAETEQIMLCEDSEGLNVISYLQVRGSIPVSWKQLPDLNLNPEVIFLIILTLIKLTYSLSKSYQTLKPIY